MAVSQGKSSGMLEDLFKLNSRNTTVSTEVMAGITTFMTMSYIIFVNPAILADAGVPQAGATTATIIGAALMCILMGLVTNYPLALASGMGLNAFLAYGVIIGRSLPWQTGMLIIFIEGVIVTLLVLTNVREHIMNAIPMDIKRAIGAGIGLFITLIGLMNSGLVVISDGLPAFGDIRDPGTLLATIGLLFTAVLVARRVHGALFIGIIVSTLLGMLPWIGATQLPPIGSWISLNLDFSTFGGALSKTAFSGFSLGLTGIIFAFLLSDFFDTMGTVISVGGQAGLVDKEGRLPGLRNVLFIDSIAAAIGGLFGASSITTYVESASGVSVGGRTGLTSVVAGLFFLLALLFIPLIGAVPGQATAPALVIVGFLMMTVAKEIEWDNASTAIPAFLTLAGIPLTYSIADGIGMGILGYIIIQLFAGNGKKMHPLLYIVGALFVVHFLLK
ncbi:MAG TPA: NCS2 family permease [Firmicutes bacterium]|jgi:AGZA family xanthine/uracil permease-like MFS transporter|nr:NCS2 family permease [Bacillota bacterium]